MYILYSLSDSPLCVLQEWELLALKTLNWDLAAITPYTILNQLLTHQLLQPQTNDTRLKKIAGTVRRHSIDLITMSLV